MSRRLTVAPIVPRLAATLTIIVGVALVVAGAAGSTSTAPAPLKIGIAAAKTGTLAVYDDTHSKAFMLRMNQINKAGGLLGRKVQVRWIDSRTDKATDAIVARQLLDW